MDYSKFMLKPFEQSTYDYLGGIKEFAHNWPNKNKLFDFMILLWDINSELKRIHPDYFERKRQAAICAGLDVDSNGNFSPEIEEIILGGNNTFNVAVIQYLMMHAIPEYPALVATLELQAQELAESFKQTDKPKDRETISNNVKRTTDQRREYEKSIFGGEEVENVRRALYERIERDKIRLRPEDMGAAIDKKQLSHLPDPYGFKKQKPHKETKKQTEILDKSAKAKGIREFNAAEYLRKMKEKAVGNGQ